MTLFYTMEPIEIFCSRHTFFVTMYGLCGYLLTQDDTVQLECVIGYATSFYLVMCYYPVSCQTINLMATSRKEFCCNYIFCTVVVGGTAVMTSLIEGLSVELATALVVAVMFTYTYIGCLGATFYVSYFNTAIIFIIMLVFLVKVYHDDGDRNPLGKKT